MWLFSRPTILNAFFIIVSILLPDLVGVTLYKIRLKVFGRDLVITALLGLYLLLEYGKYAVLDS